MKQLKQYVTIVGYAYTIQPSRHGVHVVLHSTSGHGDLLTGDAAASDITWDAVESAEQRNGDAIAEWVRDTIHSWRMARLEAVQ